LEPKPQEFCLIVTRSILFAVCLVLQFTSANAAGLDDLKAANAAAAKGTGDEAIQLFTQALGVGDLSAADQFIAYGGRGREYSAKSQIADAFERYDDGRRLRDNAISDFSAALSLKADDDGILVERGLSYHMNQQFDLAVADFSAALKLKNSPTILVERASSQRAKGAYEDAVADCTAALAIEVRDPGLEKWDIYNERGYAEFLAGRYDAAATDFDKALALGASALTGDVLWLPYQLAWLHIAHARAGHDDAEELGSFSDKIDENQWPGILIPLFLGKTTLEDASAPSSHGGMMGRSRDCNLSLFAGEDTLGKANVEQARQLLQRAHEVCNIHTLQYLVSATDLDRMRK
jgi:tetratricopeptide (TPR) repeat protein